MSTVERPGPPDGPRVVDFSGATSGGFADDQFAAPGNVVAVDGDDVGRFRTHGVLPAFSRTPGAVIHAGPLHSEHDVAVYSDRGRSAADSATLEREGVV